MNERGDIVENPGSADERYGDEESHDCGGEPEYDAEERSANAIAGKNSGDDKKSSIFSGESITGGKSAYGVTERSKERAQCRADLKAEEIHIVSVMVSPRAAVSLLRQVGEKVLKGWLLTEVARQRGDAHAATMAPSGMRPRREAVFLLCVDRGAL